MQKPVSSDRRRNGYTLVEILIVVAIVSAVAALAIPALRGPLEKTRLRSAARTVQTAIGKARNAAIRTGRTHTIEYEPGTGRFRLDRSPEPSMPEFETGGVASAIPDSVDELLEPTSTAESTALQFELPEGVYFARTLPQPNTSFGNGLETEADFLQPDSASTTETDLLADGIETRKWSAPVALYPNGRSDDVVIRIATEASFVDVTVRGLTGVASFSQPRRWPANGEGQVEESPLTAASTREPTDRVTEVRR